VVVFVPLCRPFAASQGSVVVDIGHLVAHLPTVVSVPVSCQALRVH
jgi:hypothetical protein